MDKGRRIYCNCIIFLKMIGIEAGNVVEVNGQVEGFCGLVEVGDERLIAAHA